VVGSREKATINVLSRSLGVGCKVGAGCKVGEIEVGSDVVDVGDVGAQAVAKMTISSSIRNFFIFLPP